MHGVRDAYMTMANHAANMIVICNKYVGVVLHHWIIDIHQELSRVGRTLCVGQKLRFIHF